VIVCALLSSCYDDYPVLYLYVWLNEDIRRNRQVLYFTFREEKKKINMFPKLHVALKIHRTKSVELFFSLRISYVQSQLGNTPPTGEVVM